jgi:hypothetical protein
MSMLPMDPNFNIGQIPTTQFNIPQPRQGGGMFGGGGKKILSALAEAMAAYSAGMGNPGGMAVLQGMNHRRQAKADAETQEQQYQRQRMDGRDDYLWKQEHAPPPNPHYFEDNTGNLMAIGPDGQPQVVYKDPNPFKLVPNGMGGVVPVNMEELMRNYKPAPPGVTFTPVEDGGPAASPPARFPLGFRP